MQRSTLRGKALERERDLTTFEAKNRWGFEMVHICCLAEGCRRIIHLSELSHWNYKGQVKCPRCGAEMKVEIRDGEVISLKRL